MKRKARIHKSNCRSFIFKGFGVLNP
uniref:Uncharacterized protein n=1 Tax=Arundo donax TaxID=35708 RepID=A0A0A8Z300_ARUDO